MSQFSETSVEALVRLSRRLRNNIVSLAPVHLMDPVGLANQILARLNYEGLDFNDLKDPEEGEDYAYELLETIETALAFTEVVKQHRDNQLGDFRFNSEVDVRTKTAVETIDECALIFFGSLDATRLVERCINYADINYKVSDDFIAFLGIFTGAYMSELRRNSFG